MKAILIDNYDSFTYNLSALLKVAGFEVEVYFNDEIQPAYCEKFDLIVFSPGPKLPKDAGRMPEIIAMYATHKPLLGICLGHQAIAEYCGASLYNLDTVLHGAEDQMTITEPESILFKGLESPVEIGRYHSWSVDYAESGLKSVALTSDHASMAFEDPQRMLFGMQFHPESVMTPQGLQMIQNLKAFLELKA